MSVRLRTVRVLLSILTIGGGLYGLLEPGMLSAEESGPGCEFAEPSGDFACKKPAKHIYQRSCEGVDCYYNIEMCCT